MIGRIWVKVDCDFDDHPKAEAAGYHGKNLFQLLLRINRKRGMDGRIPPRFASSSYLARRLPLDLPTTELAIKDAEDAELIRRSADGGIEITGWDDEWRGSQTSTERVRNWRERHREETDCNADTVSSVSCNGETTIEEKRREERRREGNVSVSDLGSAENKKQEAVVSKWHETARRILGELSAARMRVKNGLRPIKPTFTALEGICRRLEAGATEEECRAVIAACEQECKKNKASLDWFDAISPWRPENFERKLAKAPVRSVSAVEDPLAEMSRRAAIREGVL